MNILDKINNLCFDLQHGDELTKEQWDKVEQIFKLSLPIQLNENQQDLITWMQENKCDTNDPLESISDLFIGGWSLSLVSWESCLSAAYQKLTNRQKAELVQEYLNQYLEQENE
ncbi:hypothetical protein IGJ51_000384 [Enterococcus sp. DIV0802c]|uniref:hypothetical protein n=1 Tax=Enterococcus sp. DIV0802c TaxID=2774743 RepID=UPI003F259B0C